MKYFGPAINQHPVKKFEYFMIKDKLSTKKNLNLKKKHEVLRILAMVVEI